MTVNDLSSFFSDESGQSTVEYMLLISVIVIAIVAAAYIFIPTMQVTGPGGWDEATQALARIALSQLDDSGHYRGS
tara:strand:- start:634 stop:861 length:228 start_codon:yes stop_codon:yes gene_type:complete